MSSCVGSERIRNRVLKLSFVWLSLRVDVLDNVIAPYFFMSEIIGVPKRTSECFKTCVGVRLVEFSPLSFAFILHIYIYSESIAWHMQRCLQGIDQNIHFMSLQIGTFKSSCSMTQ